MQNISKEYLLLFNTLTETENTLQKLYAGLIIAQQRAEELYMSKSDTADGPAKLADRPC